MVMVLVWVAACGVDKPNIATTPLDGSVGCVHVVCGPDELCLERTFSVDAGVQDNCVTPGPGCPVFDCAGDGCPSCIHAPVRRRRRRAVHRRRGPRAVVPDRERPLMTSSGRVIALAFALLAACGSPKAVQPDAGPPPTSLAGSIACGGSTCGSGQLCDDEVGQDAGIAPICVDVPPACSVSDCTGYGSTCTNCTCSDCLAKLCAYYPTVPFVQVEGPPDHVPELLGGMIRAVRRVIGLAVALGACGRIGFGATTSTTDASAPGDGDGGQPDAAIAVVLVSDDFARTVGASWGDADIGGTWTLFNPDSSTVTVGADHGRMTLSTTTAYVDTHVAGTTALDSETRVTLQLDRVPATGSYTVTISARWVTTGTDYRLHVDVLAGGVVSVFIDRGVAGSYSTVAMGTFAGSIAPDTDYTMSLVATGASPTALCGRLWRTSTAEPTDCSVTATDATPELQVPGISYVDAYDSGGTPPVLSFNTFRYLRIGPE